MCVEVIKQVHDIGRQSILTRISKSNIGPFKIIDLADGVLRGQHNMGG